ncbi:MAG: alanyl-tRNA editing protein [Candidatus Micrarchaeota archaeon]|nr:alanyl-tRNA editing protein [Candidatus Micrarchaeota archaeon]
MTVKLYLDDPYLKEFDARIVRRGDGFVVLDKTAFYPKSGGQDHDMGFLNNVPVVRVTRNGDDIFHFVEGMIGSDTVHGIIDWERRYALMKMHTAQHIISGIIARRYGVRTIGVSIETGESALKTEPLEINLGVITDIVEDFADIVRKRTDLKFYEIDREDALKRVDPLRIAGIQKLPASIRTLRVVEIPGADICTCAGTHVKNTRELGNLEITRHENADGSTIIYFSVS